MSSMLRHFQNENNGGGNVAGLSPVTRKKELDEALVTMIVKDTQPFSIVEDIGEKLDPTYSTSSQQERLERQWLRRDTRVRKPKPKLLVTVANIATVTLTADMWTSMNMDAYLAVTEHLSAVSCTECSTFPTGTYSGKSGTYDDIPHEGMGNHFENNLPCN
ncbi:hypothetical protein JOB18_006252 [Solea senegalensis]|uniref:Uncharacterized protein n=1 Tax=Solea senegalensis TaxID=28829 RepID=A0AAV6PWR1_SOLSE|nr:hypothetical protein JOB18_006252 [Solea senegalensis]